MRLLVLFIIIFSSCKPKNTTYGFPYNASDLLVVKKSFSLHRGCKVCKQKSKRFALQENAMVLACQEGKVVDVCFPEQGLYCSANTHRYHGNKIVIAHQDSITFTYSCLGEIRCKKGATVRKGEVIAQAGKTGLSIQNGLRLLVAIHGKAIDTDRFLAQHTKTKSL